MTKLVIALILSILIGMSCSKEEVIPFKMEERDTLSPPVSYISPSGQYRGTISNITLLPDSSYIINFSSPLTINVQDVDFSTIRIKNLTNIENSEALSSMQRFTQGSRGAYFFMQNTPSSITPINLFFGEYNGVWFDTQPNTIQYFISYTDQIDTVFQVFEGERL
ncbi:MAG: hypothetical protein RIC15_10420 [Vicingaceae bacterium]